MSDYCEIAMMSCGVIADLRAQLIAEREGRERAEARAQVAEADVVALREYLKTHFCPCIDYAEADCILSQPHPGDPLREELERLRDEVEKWKNYVTDLNCGYTERVRERNEAQTALEEVKATLSNPPILRACGTAVIARIDKALNAGKEAER